LLGVDVKNRILGSIVIAAILAASPGLIPFSMSATAQDAKSNNKLAKLDRAVQNRKISTIVSNNPSELIREILFDEGDAYITVPEKDVTSLYSGRLRRYDLHIAKMFEVTSYMCQEGMVSPGINWQYYAGGGSIDMGRFRISCQLASEIENAYKVRTPEPTAIEFTQGEDNPAIVQKFYIGTLDIERDPNKTTRWLRFAQKFKPVKKGTY
jgi:hypothetical protein